MKETLAVFIGMLPIIFCVVGIISASYAVMLLLYIKSEKFMQIRRYVAMLIISSVVASTAGFFMVFNQWKDDIAILSNAKQSCDVEMQNCKEKIRGTIINLHGLDRQSLGIR